jgi:hypothetical protein
MAKTRDFTRKREKITFTIDDDTFYAHAGIPAETLIEYGAKFESVDMEKATILEKMATYRDALELCLEPTSFQRFVSRLRDTENPIDGDQLDEVTTWLFEQYGMRPTVPSEVSSGGPSDQEPGIDSTGSIKGEVLISEVSLLPTS